MPGVIARVAGEIFDEPPLLRPGPGDPLHGLVGDELGTLTKSCVACHDVYLNESGAAAGASRR